MYIYIYVYMFSYPSSMWDLKILEGNHHLRTRSWKHWFSIFWATLAICRKKKGQKQTYNNILLGYKWTMSVASFLVHSLNMSMISRNDNPTVRFHRGWLRQPRSIVAHPEAGHPCSKKGVPDIWVHQNKTNTVWINVCIYSIIMITIIMIIIIYNNI